MEKQALTPQQLARKKDFQRRNANKITVTQHRLVQKCRATSAMQGTTDRLNLPSIESELPANLGALFAHIKNSRNYGDELKELASAISELTAPYLGGRTNENK